MKRSVQKIRDRQDFCDRANDDTLLPTLLPSFKKETYLSKTINDGEALEDFNKRLADCKSNNERERLKEADIEVEEFWKRRQISKTLTWRIVLK